jgi:hypothetical protein
MPENPRKSARPSWRGENGSSGGKTGSTDYRWNRESAESGAKRPQSRRARFFRAFGALLFCCALIVGLILLVRPPKKPDFVIIGAGYTENLALPHNVWGLNLFDQLTRLSESSHNGIGAGLRSAAFTLHGAEENAEHFLLTDSDQAWKAKVKQLQAVGRGSRNRPLVVVMAMHGASDGEGAYLLPEDARPGDKPLRVQSVVDALARIGGEKKLKLLILDPTAMTDAWHFGVLRNDFATALKSVKIPKGRNVWVICSTSPGQTSWIEETTMTSFGKALSAGLAGGGRVPSKRNITVGSLVRYIGESTRDWAARHGVGDQTPLLISESGAVSIPTDAATGNGRQILARADKIELIRSISIEAKAPSDETERAVEKANAKARAEIAAAWQAIGRLERRERGAPWNVKETAASYAPLEWGRLRASAVRREQVQNAGLDALIARKSLGLGAPKKLDDALETLPRSIAKARVVPLKRSGAATLAMLAATGAPAPEPDAASRGRDQALLGTPPADFEKAWKAAKTPPRDFLDGALAQLGAEENLDQQALGDADDLLTHPALGATDLTPAEIAFVSILRANLSPTDAPRPFLLSRALAVRRRAERAALGIGSGADYAHAERLLPWIRKAVDEAGHARRVAEDLLFSTSAADHARAGELFDAAESSYTEAESQAATVRDALTLRDAALADLPPLTHWVARRHAAFADATTKTTAALDHIESLWSTVRALDDQLESHPGGDLNALAAASAKARAAYRLAWGDFDDVVNGPARRNRLVPREMLLARSVPVVDRDQFRGEDYARASKTRPPVLDGAALSKRTAEHARGQARAALASIGPVLYSRATNDFETYDLILSKVVKVNDPTKTLAAVASLGPRIGQALTWLPEHISAESATDPQLAEPVDAGPTLGLMTAARLARLIAPWQTLKSEDPVGMARRRQLIDLLKRQAERGFVDHYWNGKGALYSLYAGAYLADAADLGRGLIGAAEWEKQIGPAHAELTAALTADDSLSLVGPADPVWTSEARYPLAFHLESKPAAGAPALDGRPVAWVEPLDGGEITIDESENGDRLAMVLGAEQSTRPLRIFLRSARHDLLERQPPDRPEREAAPLRSKLFFRGRIVTDDVPLAMLHLPEIRLTAGKGSGEAKLLVRAATEFGGKNTAVALVLDNSMSMNSLVSVNSTRNKYAVATEVLKNVLNNIALKKGTHVSLWTYGQEGVKEGEGDFCRSPFQTTDWDPDRSKKDLETKLSELGANWDDTPLITTMTEAMGVLKNSGREKKLMIVLTDGSDSIPKNKNFQAGDVQRVFDGQGIVLNVVLFRTDRQANENSTVQNVVDFRKRYPNYFAEQEASENKAKEAFAGLANFTPPGAFFDATNQTKLQESLEGFLAQRPRLTLRTPDGQKITSLGDGLRVQPSDTPIERAWSVPEGFVLVQIENEEGIWVRAVRNEVLVVDVAMERGRYQVTRGLASDSPVVLESQTAPESPAWRLAVSQSVPARLAGVSLGVSLEDVSHRRQPGLEPSIGGQQAFLRQVLPKSVWFEIVGPDEGVSKPFHVEFRRLADCAAPTWETYLPAPPIGAAFTVQPSTLRAWFRETDSSAITRVGADALTPGKVIDQAGTVLEFADVEPHSVAGDDGADRMDVDCLTIRLKCPPGTLSRVTALEIDGGIVSLQEEHRFYRSANRVTALYWPFPKERLSALKSITVQSIDGMKADKATRQIDLKLDASWLGKAATVAPSP